MVSDDFFYNHLKPNLLLKALRNHEIVESLAYMATYQKYHGLIVTPRDHSILIQNDLIIIAVVLYSGFEENEFNEIKVLDNLHLVALSEVILEMIEFESMNIKFIDSLALLLTTISRSNNDFGKDLHLLKNYA